MVHSPLIDISKSKLEEAIEKAQIFVETEVYEEAKKKLEYSRTLIISGDQGLERLHLQINWHCIIMLNLDFIHLFMQDPWTIYMFQNILMRKR